MIRVEYIQYRLEEIEKLLQNIKDEIKLDIRNEIKNLDKNITNVVSRTNGTLEIYVKKTI